MNSFESQYPVKQYFGKGCAEEALKKVMRDSADTCVLTPGCCKKFTRDEIFEILKERM